MKEDCVYCIGKNRDLILCDFYKKYFSYDRCDYCEKFIIESDYLNNKGVVFSE